MYREAQKHVLHQNIKELLHLISMFVRICDVSFFLMSYLDKN